MDNHRNRAEGWKHAKLTGHENEDMVKRLLDTDVNYRSDFLKRIGAPHEIIIGTEVGGIHESNVPGVIGRKTKSKTVLRVFLKNGRITNISVKKSLGGQVYFVSAELFIKTFKAQFDKYIPDTVRRAIALFGQQQMMPLI